MGFVDNMQNIDFFQPYPVTSNKTLPGLDKDLKDIWEQHCVWEAKQKMEYRSYSKYNVENIQTWIITAPLRNWIQLTLSWDYAIAASILCETTNRGWKWYSCYLNCRCISHKTCCVMWCNKRNCHDICQTDCAANKNSSQNPTLTNSQRKTLIRC